MRAADAFFLISIHFTVRILRIFIIFSEHQENQSTLAAKNEIEKDRMTAGICGRVPPKHLQSRRSQQLCRWKRTHCYAGHMWNVWLQFVSQRSTLLLRQSQRPERVRWLNEQSTAQGKLDERAKGEYCIVGGYFVAQGTVEEGRRLGSGSLSRGNYEIDCIFAMKCD